MRRVGLTSDSLPSLPPLLPTLALISPAMFEQWPLQKIQSWEGAERQRSEGLGPKVVLERSSGVAGTRKQGGCIPDILKVESKAEGCPRAFWKGAWKETEGEFLERSQL